MADTVKTPAPIAPPAVAPAAVTPPAPPAVAAPAPAAVTTDAKKNAPRIAPVTTGVFKIEPPVKATNRGGKSEYPFDSLTEVGQCFGVKNKTASNMSSIVHNANKRARTAKLDAAGNPEYNTKPLTDGNGNVTHVPDTESPKFDQTKHFYSYDVTADFAPKLIGTPLEGSSVLIFRDV